METECVICMEGYRAEGEKRPKLLPCSHTFCLSCLRRLNSLHGNVRCPECRKVNPVDGAGVEAFATNRYILAHLEQLEEERGKKREEGTAPVSEDPPVVTEVTQAQAREEQRRGERERRREEERRKKREHMVILRVPHTGPDQRVMINIPEEPDEGDRETTGRAGTGSTGTGSDRIQDGTQGDRGCCKRCSSVLLHTLGILLGLPLSIVAVGIFAGVVTAIGAVVFCLAVVLGPFYGADLICTRDYSSVDRVRNLLSNCNCF